jgi:hypothetical protein
MDVTIKTEGFTLDDRSRDAIAARAHQLAGVTSLLVTIEGRVARIFSGTPDYYLATARAMFESEAVTFMATATDRDELIEGLFAQLESAAVRRRWLADGTPAPCAWCGGGAFALVAAQRLGAFATDTLVCAGCGHVEQFVRDVRTVTALEDTVVVHARAKPPYR